MVCRLSITGRAGSNPAEGIYVCVVCVVQSRQKAKCRTLKTKKQVRMKYRVQENKKNPSGGVDACVVCCAVKTNEQARTIKIKQQVWKKYKDKTREKFRKKSRRWQEFLSLVCDECCFDVPITRPGELYRVWVCHCVWSHAVITLYTYSG